MAVYIGDSVNSGPSNQTDLKGRHRCNLGGGREPTFEGEHDIWVPWAGRPAGGADWPHMSASRGLSWRVAFWCLLEPSSAGFVVDKYD